MFLVQNLTNYNFTRYWYLSSVEENAMTMQLKHSLQLS